MPRLETKADVIAHIRSLPFEVINQAMDRMGIESSAKLESYDEEYLRDLAQVADAIGEES